MDIDAKHRLVYPVEDIEPVAERLIFSFRAVLLLIFAIVTVYLAWNAVQVKPSTSFEKMIPTQHEYVSNFLQRRDELTGLGNAVRLSVESIQGDIFNADYLETLRQISDEVFYIPGVGRAGLKSLWTPNVRWGEVTEEGFAGGTVIPDAYDGSAQSLERLRNNVLKSGQVGTLVANDFKSTIVYVPLLEINPETGEKLDYWEFSQALETLIRDKYQNDTIRIHITGFAKIVGDLIDGAAQVVIFFFVAIGITLVLLYGYSGCVRSTLTTLVCSLVAVVWQIGLLKQLGYGLDPYSMLVPFLIFAIAVSHGVQVINSILHGAAQGLDKEASARFAFRSLYIPGLTALVSDGFGFATLMVIEIPVIQELAIAASIGVAAIILTNLLLLPILMSYFGVSPKAVKQQERSESRSIFTNLWHGISVFTQKRPAGFAIVIALVLFSGSYYYSLDMKIGDLDAGAPELRPDSRYNLDNKFITENYSTSTDVFVVMVETEDMHCVTYETYAAIDLFQWVMADVPGIQSTFSLVDASKRAIAGNNEGNLKWMTISRNQFVLNGSVSGKEMPPGLMNSDCNLVPVLLFLEDHKAETLSAVVTAVEKFKSEYDTGNVRFLMAAGNSGIEAATNIVVEASQYKMLAWVYAVVSLLVFLVFRSIRAVICIIAPLALTSVMSQALMAKLGIGVKVATLPVIALGVGIGVDYGVYIYSKLEFFLSRGIQLKDAYLQTLKATGKAVVFTGLTLAIGVATWVWSPIKFQGDMGILLTFMFLLNMLGAVVLLPALVSILMKRDVP